MSSSFITTMPIIDLNLEMKKIAINGCIASSVIPFPCTTYNDGYASTNTNPPSKNVFIDKAVYMSLPVTITYTGTASVGNILNIGKDALRAYPLHSILQSATCVINGFTLTLTPNPIVHPTSHYRGMSWSLAPHYTDKYQEYADGVGAVNNPLGSFKDEVDTGKNESLPRGAFPMVVTNGPTSATIQTTIVDAMMIPPFSDGGADLGFTNITTMQWNLVYYNPLSRIVSHVADPTINITSVAVTLGQPTLYLKCYTPPSSYIPRDISYPSQIINILPTQSSTAMAPNATLQIDSSNMQLTNIPQHMYIFVRNADADMTYTKTDTYAAITNVSIRWNNTSGYLSSYSAFDLFTMCKENGLEDNWSEFSGLVQSSTTLGTQVGLAGSVIKVIFGKDLPINSPEQYVGMPGNWNFTCQINCKNVSQSSTITHPTLYVLPVYSSEFRIPVSGNPTHTIISEIVEPDAQYIPFEDSLKYFGGDFKGSIKKMNKWFKDNKVISSMANALSGIPQIGPIASAVGKIAADNGYGLIGGAQLTKAQLLDRIRRS